MKIAIVTGNSNRAQGFYNSQEVGLAKELLSFKIDVDVFEYSPRGTLRFESLLERVGHQARLVNYPGWELPGKQVFSWRLLRFFLKHGKEYSLIQVHDSTVLVTAMVSFIALFLHRPCILCQGMYRDHSIFYKRILQKGLDLIYLPILKKSICYVVCKTNDAWVYIRGKGLLKERKFSVINVGLDVSRLDSDDNGINDGLPDRIDVLYVGVLEKRRNPDFIIELFSRLAKGDLSWKFCVVGSGPESEWFDQQLKKSGLEDRVTRIKAISNSQIWHVYSRSKVLILPTSYEIYGMVIMEAMYFGVPVVATAEAGPKQIITDGVDGALINGFDIDVWETRIRKLLHDPGLRALWGEKARQKIKEGYLWDKIAKEYFQVYQTVLNNVGH